MSVRGVLSIWTVYDHPKDYPDQFVARLFVIDERGVQATASFVAAKDLDMLRHVLGIEMGLHRLPRNEADDDKIVETWL